ncbi:MAG: hypothetical protein LAT51_13705 [Flavobacteriaceae bacterium]|nr:hypothetical protein [Flavobacteriaceae bacterium]
MRNSIAILFFILIISCQKEDKTYYEDGTLKTVAEIHDSKFHGSFKAYYENGELEMEGNYENGLMEGVFKYNYPKNNKKFSKSEIFFKSDTAYYRWKYNKSGKLVEEGFAKQNKKAGRWIYYEPMKDSIKEIKEYFHIGDKKHLNQVLEVNPKGDTIGGEYFWLSFKEPLTIKNQLINFHLKELSYLDGSEFYLCIPTNESENFEFDFTNESKVKLDTIRFNLEKDPSPIELNYTTPGEKSFRGFIIEHWESPEPEVTDFDLVTRKIYFDEEIFIEDRSKGKK